MGDFKLSIEDQKDDKIKIEVNMGDDVGAAQLCEIFFTAGHTLQQTHKSVLQALFFCCLQVLKEDEKIMDQVSKILKHGER